MEQIIAYFTNYLKLYDRLSKTTSVDIKSRKRILDISPYLSQVMFAFRNRKYCMKFINNLIHSYELLSSPTDIEEFEKFKKHMINLLVQYKSKANVNIVNEYIASVDPSTTNMLSSMSRQLINPSQIKKLYKMLRQIADNKASLTQIKDYVVADKEIAESKEDFAKVDRYRIVSLLILLFIHRFFPSNYNNGINFVKKFLNMLVAANRIESDEDELDTVESKDSENIESNFGVENTNISGVYNGYTIPIMRKDKTMMVIIPFELLDNPRSSIKAAQDPIIHSVESNETPINTTIFMKYLDALGIKPKGFYLYNIDLKPVNGDYFISRVKYNNNLKKLTDGGPQILKTSKDNIEQLFKIKI